MKKLITLYTRWAGVRPCEITPLPVSGSSRRYFRILGHDHQAVIGVIGNDKRENQAFVYLSHHFSRKGLNVPKILSVESGGMRYLISDMGDESLYDRVAKGRAHEGRYDANEQQWLTKAVSLLPEIQIGGAAGLRWEKCFPQPELDRMSVMFDLNYFKYCFLKTSGTEFDEFRLQADFETLADHVLRAPREAFMYRDFQVRNILIDSNGDLGWIDYQGGRKGPYYYDLASFLWQASAKYSPRLRKKLTDVYYQALSRLTPVPSRSDFDEMLSHFVLFRQLQVLGAYGYRGRYEGKQYFVQSIPSALSQLAKLLRGVLSTTYPYLCTVLKSLAQKQPQMQADALNQTTKSKTEVIQVSSPKETPRLEVTVWSFSYRKGIPADETSNGGGYVWDCRGIHNPGRYDAYKPLTGLDEAVIGFLEQDGEITAFLKHVYAVAERHVEVYIKRGFEHLMFAFGCTGGQHRSVYSAQHLGQYLSDKYGIKVTIIHREQGIKEVLPARRT